MIQISIDGTEYETVTGDRLIDAINHAGVHLPQVCYHPQLGPIQTCDTCVIQVNGKVRDRLTVSPAIGEDELRELALAAPGIVKSLAGREIRTVIVRAPKLVNIVPVPD